MKTNFEAYKEQIIAFLAAEAAVTKDGLVDSCEITPCKECVFYNDDNVAFCERYQEFWEEANAGYKEDPNELEAVKDEGAYDPTRAHGADGGLDLYARETAVVKARGSYVFDTGIHVKILKGYFGLLFSKSGLNVNHGLTSEGIIDSGYTGSIRVKLYNDSDIDYKVEAGDKISQLLIVPCLLPTVKFVEKLENTERADGGFGSTGRGTSDNKAEHSYTEPVKPKLTRLEREFCLAVRGGFLSRDKGGLLTLSEVLPEKRGNVWATPVGFGVRPVPVQYGEFSFIKWEDEDPWAIDELLELEVKEDDN